MRNREKEKKDSRETTQSSELGVEWDLSEEDKQFLRSCNISPN